MTEIELLAPARNADIAIEAIRHGADAVYMGSQSHGARAAASNSLNDVARVVDIAHSFNARVYVTLNTLIYEHELAEVECHIRQLYRIGVDALIVQDMSVLRLDIPPIALHASTQCDIRSASKAKFLENLGFSQLVLPREMSLAEIKAVRDAVSVPLEAFVHGALCVSYSGDCQASFISTGRSANRGECSQMCRLPYDLKDGKGKDVALGRHLLSLRDMNRSARLRDMISAGVTSFKIEGRLKDVGYVKNIVAYYDSLLRDIVAENKGLVRRSAGKTELTFTPMPDKSFSRGCTEYFLDGTPAPDFRMASIHTPKSKGTYVGTVKKVINRRVVDVDAAVTLANGDGLTYTLPGGELKGFRVNRVDGMRIMSALDIEGIKPGMKLNRNRDKAFDDMLAAPSASRFVEVDICLRKAAGLIVADAADTRGVKVSVTEEYLPDPAKTPQGLRQQMEMAKLGATSYRLCHFKSDVGDRFLPASLLARLRRALIESLDRASRMVYCYDLRRPENLSAEVYKPVVDRHENVANTIARNVYESHGAIVENMAIEAGGKAEHAPVVMTTRYCIRRELGICLRKPEGRKVPEPLSLSHGRDRFELEFLCGSCGMRIRKVN